MSDVHCNGKYDLLGGVVAGRENGVSLARIGCGVSTGEAGGAGIGVKKEKSVRRLTVAMRTLVPTGPGPSGKALLNVCGVGVRGTVRDPARGMTSRSVRKRQQPPSLERLEIMLRRWSGSVNGFSIGLESQVAGIA